MDTLCIHFFMEVSGIAREKDMYINEQIRAREVMVIGPNGEQPVSYTHLTLPTIGG